MVCNYYHEATILLLDTRTSLLNHTYVFQRADFSNKHNYDIKVLTSGED